MNIFLKRRNAVMKRFMGLMPSDEVTINKYFIDSNKLRIRIQAGPHGWTIIYADSSTSFQDNDAKPEENFANAYDVAKSKLGELREID